MQSSQTGTAYTTNQLNLNQDSLISQQNLGGTDSLPGQSNPALPNFSNIAPDSIVPFCSRPELSQFRSVYIPDGYDYQKHLVKQLPFDSLHTVLKGVEVVFTGRKISRNNPDWLIGVILICFLLVATVRLIFNKYLNQLMLSTISYSTFVRTFNEKFFNLLHASFRLDIVFNTVISLFFYQFLTVKKINFGLHGSFQIFLACLGTVIAYFTAKRILYYLIGVLTESGKEVQEYLFGITVYNRVLGIFLLPVCTIAAFISASKVLPVLYFGLILIVLFYISSLVRGGKIFLKKQFSILYLILYLCTLEFFPLLLLAIALPF